MLSNYSNYQFWFFFKKKKMFAWLFVIFACSYKNMIASNLGNRYFSSYLSCFSFYFSIVFILNKLFIGFLINLKGKILYFNKFEKQNVECKETV